MSVTCARTRAGARLGCGARLGFGIGLGLGLRGGGGFRWRGHGGGGAFLSGRALGLGAGPLVFHCGLGLGRCGLGSAAGKRLAVNLPNRVVLIGNLAVGCREFLAFNAVEHGVEEVPRDRDGQVGGAPAPSVDGDALVAAAMARPNGHGVLRGVSAEPQVGRGLGGTGLAGEGLVHRELSTRGRTAGDDSLQDIVDLGGNARIEDALGAVLMLVDNLAVTVLNLGDRHGIAMLATHGEGGVCLGHLKR